MKAVLDFLHASVANLVLVLVGLLTMAIGIWGVLALVFSGPHSDAVRYSLAIAVAIAALLTLIALFLRRWRWRAITAYLVLFTALLAWYFSIEPSNERDWQTDVAVLPYSTIEGDIVTVHNIRNFDYHSETDYTPAHYDKRFDLSKLNGVDLIAVYWMGPAIAHVFLSFDFGANDHLAISIEARKEKGEGYSTFKGFFRQYELYYVVADERDVIRLRTNYRHNPPEDVYVYRVAGKNGVGRQLFLEYFNRINALKVKPEWYNSLTTNCTTNIWKISRALTTHLPFSWKILASGYVPEYLYEHNRLITDGLSFSDLQRRAHINDKAHAADAVADFSSRIRQNPEMPLSGNK